MTKIADLPVTTASQPLTGAAAFAYAKGGTGPSYTATLDQLLAYFTANFASPDFSVETAAPTLSGFTATITATTTNAWLIISPTGTMATGTVVFPPAADAFDGMTVLVTTTQQITALTVSSVGATFVGSPTTMGVGASVTWRYNTASLKWYVVSNTGGSTATFDDIQINGNILDLNGNVIVELSPDYSLPVDPADIRHLKIESGTSSLSLTAANTGGSAVLNVSGQGGGGMVLGLTDGPTTVQGDAVSVSADSSDLSLISGDNVVIDAGSGDTVAARIGGNQVVGFSAAFNENTVPPTKPTFTVATLPAVGTVPVGACAIVTDADTPVLGDVVTGGGAVRVGVNSDGTNWRVG